MPLWALIIVVEFRALHRPKQMLGPQMEYCQYSVRTALLVQSLFLAHRYDLHCSIADLCKKAVDH
jgi:hypothetical protein